MEKIDPNGSMYFNRVNPDTATQLRELEARREKEQQMAKAMENCSCTNIAHHGGK